MKALVALWFKYWQVLEKSPFSHPNEAERLQAHPPFRWLVCSHLTVSQIPSVEVSFALR